MRRSAPDGARRAGARRACAPWLSGAGARIAADPEVTRYRNGEPLSRADAWRNMATFLGHWLLRGCGMGAVARVRERWVIRRTDAWRDRDDAIPQKPEASPAAT